MISFELRWAATAMGAVIPAGAADITVRRVSTDSRDIRPGDLFFAITGPRFDGHDFVAQAAKAGAVACVVNRPIGVAAAPSVPHLVVDDTIRTLGRLAKRYREECISHETVVVAVTGSNGKTTTKCMIDHVLSSRLPGKASPRSFNNHIGVPLTILSVEANDRYLVAEVGSNARGEIATLSRIVGPDVAVITSVGEAHLEGLGTVDDVSREKTSILDCVRPGGFALVNVDRPEIHPHVLARPKVRVVSFGFDASARLRVTDPRVTLRGTTCELEGRYRIELPMPGVHHATNAAAAFAVARWFGIAPDDILARLSTFAPPEGRTRVLSLAAGKVVDDTYNANPASVRAAIAALRAERVGRRVFVLGDMLELGPVAGDFHERIVREVASAGIEMLIVHGSACIAAAEQARAAGSQLTIVACPAPDDVVRTMLPLLDAGWTAWVKGSRGMQLDRVVARLEGTLRAQAAVA